LPQVPRELAGIEPMKAAEIPALLTGAIVLIFIARLIADELASRRR
jgi:hypothetical protein